MLAGADLSEVDLTQANLVGFDLTGSNLSQAKLDACRDPVEAVQWAVAERALGLGIDVILDFGTWSRQEREEFRTRAAALGARSEIRYLDVPRAVLAASVGARNAALPEHAFHVSEAQLDEWSRAFEPPTADELHAREPT